MSAAVAHHHDEHKGPVTRSDLESKLRELQGGVTDTAQSAKSTVIAAGAVVAVGVVALAWWMGRRAGKKRTTIVEVRRV